MTANSSHARERSPLEVSAGSAPDAAQIVDALPGTLVAVYDASLICIAVRGGLVVDLAIECDRVLDRPAGELLGPDVWEQVRDRFAEALSGQTTTFDQHWGRDGAVYEVQLSPWRQHGAVAGVLSVTRDVTERRRDEALLAEHQRLVAETQEAARIGSWELELATGRRRWSRQQLMLHDLAPDARPPERDEYMRLVHPDDRDRFEATLAEHARTRAAFRFEYRVCLASGTRVILTEGAVLPATADRGERLVGTSRDVTHERAAQAAARAAQEQFRQSFDHALIGMQIFDLEGRYVRVNDAFCAIVGHPRDVLVGLSREQITHPDDHAEDAASLQALLDGVTTAYTREKRYLHATGHPVWASISVTLIRDPAGRPQHFIAQAQDITERRRYESQLKHMADHDPLTGLYNRRSFARELDGHIKRSRRLGARGAVLMIDLDNFKFYNDTQGHAAGDALIVRIAQALRNRLRESDVIARLGGDEFAVLLTDGGPDDADRIARELLRRVNDEAPAGPISAGKRVTASIGIAAFDDRYLTGADEMMVDADLAMYEAKNNGRDTVAHYRTEQHERPRIASQMKWATEISAALAEDRFELVAQPIVALQSESPEQYELLLRMRLPNGDLVPPGTFLYIAERLNMIADIDRWVVDQAIAMLAESQRAGSSMRLEVNLSGQTIGSAALLDFIEQRLAADGVEPDRLIFEVTETAAVANIARAAEFADRLSELGCKFALDDFGAGFGSFYYLKHLPFDYLKIDGEFVRQCTTNGTDRTLITAVVDIARGMGKRTIAEFIEDQETVEMLTAIGVDYGQGFHLGRPSPLSDRLAA